MLAENSVLKGKCTLGSAEFLEMLAEWRKTPAGKAHYLDVCDDDYRACTGHV